MTQATVGICRLCHQTKALTKEHIPPQGAYRGRSYRVQVQDAGEYLSGRKGRIFQRGFHSLALCEECNTTTGGWYGDEFARWSRWGMDLLETLRKGTDAAHPPHEGRPLLIAKQIVCTLLAASQPSLGTIRPDLRQFVLDPAAVAAQPIELYTYLCGSSAGRTSGLAHAFDPEGRRHVLSEVALAPFGYLLSLEGTAFDTRPTSIAWFATERGRDTQSIQIGALHVLPTHEPFPGDYRTKAEIRRDVIRNILIAQNHPSPDETADRIIADGRGPAFFEEHGETWD